MIPALLELAVSRPSIRLLEILVVLLTLLVLLLHSPALSPGRQDELFVRRCFLLAPQRPSEEYLMHINLGVFFSRLQEGAPLFYYMSHYQCSCRSSGDKVGARPRIFSSLRLGRSDDPSPIQGSKPGAFYIVGSLYFLLVGALVNRDDPNTDK